MDECGSEHRSDLCAGRSLRDFPYPCGQRRRVPTREAPVLFEDANQARDIDGDSRFKDVVVVTVAVDTPVHATDDGFPVGDQELHVVDLVAAVIELVDALGDATRGKDSRGTAID